MKGHEHIINMRLQGLKPEIVFVCDYPCETDWHEHNDHPTVSVHGDNIETLDMRFLVGVVVSVSSNCEKRARRLFKAVLGAKPLACIGVHLIPGKKAWEQDGHLETYYSIEYGKHHS